jgi:hypothetical protein
MGPKEKIGRSVMTMVDGMKDAVAIELSTVLNALQLEHNKIEHIVSVCRSTIDTSYAGGSRVIDREISDAFAAVTAASAALPATAQNSASTKKKGQVHSSSCNDS